MRLLLLGSALMLMSSTTAIWAADEAPGDSSASASTTQGVDLRSIIDSVSQRTHKKFLIDPRVRATVTLVGMPARDVSYPLLLTILAVHNFAVFDQDGVTVVTPDANDRYFPSSIVPPDAIHASDAEVVTTVVPLKNARAPQLVAILRPLVPNNGLILGESDRNAVVIVDRAADVRRLVSIIHELDKLPVRTE